MKFTLFLILIVAQTCLAEEISFDYKNTSQTASINFTDDLVVRVGNVNTVDYKYTIKIEGVEGEKTVKGPEGLLPFSPEEWDKYSPQIPLHGTSQVEDVLKSINTLFQSRLNSFSPSAWDSINTELIHKVMVWRVTNKVELENAEFIPDKPRAEMFTLLVDQADLIKAVREAGKGGHVFIKVSASPVIKKAVRSGSGDDILIREDKTAVPKDKATKDHLKSRVFRIDLENPSRIQFALGPFMANINQTRHGKVLAYSEEADPQFQVGETESGDWVWGLAGTWNARAIPLGKGWSIGLQMGFALAGERELDKSVLGLVGVFLSPGGQGNIFLSAGIAGGIEEKIGGNWENGFPIDSDQELPLVNDYVLRGYGAMTFSF